MTVGSMWVAAGEAIALVLCSGSVGMEEEVTDGEADREADNSGLFLE